MAENSLNSIMGSRMNKSSASLINENNVPKNIKDLEHQIGILKTGIQRNIWLLGQRLSKINEDKLYEEQGYKTFEEYCELHLDISRRNVYNFIKIFKTFTFVQTSAHDTSKLVELARIEDQDKREEILKKTEEEKLSVRKIRELINEIKGSKKQNKEIDTLISYIDNFMKKMENLPLPNTDQQKDKLKALIKFIEEILK